MTAIEQGSFGVQLIFREPVKAGVHHELASLRWRVARAELDPLEEERTGRIIEECEASPLIPLYLCYPQQVYSLPWCCDAEILNEPDIGGHGWPRMEPADYARMVNTLVPWAQAHDIGLWTGGISNPSGPALTWLGAVLARLDPSVHVCVHRYPQQTGDPFAKPRAGYASREEEAAVIRKVIGTRLWGISECGFSRARFRRLCWHGRISQVQQLERTEQELRFWRAQGAHFVIVYQINDGPADSEEQFGLRAEDGTWNPVAQAAWTIGASNSVAGN